MGSIFDFESLQEVRRRLRIEPGHLRRLRNAFFKKHLPADEVLAHLPEAQRAAFAAEVSFHTLTLHSRHDSQVDGASKLIFRTPRGHLIETVILRIASGRTALCVSSQVGCAAKCSFCATGHMGIAHNLSVAEILDQVAQANRLLRPEDRAVRNVVFMGMGEPLHTEDAVVAAAEMLQSPADFALAPGRVLISTVGIPDALVRVAHRLPQASFALSLHSARQEQREKIIPLARRYPLDQLRAAIQEVTTLQQRPLMIEYLLLDGVNDSADDLTALADYLTGLSVHINLIPYNPIEDAPHLHGTPPDRRHEFADSLEAAGFTVTIRYSLGADIAAACGQLVRRENRHLTSVHSAPSAPAP
jgi:23S rRNA (adenine2503-C2)-methyltransferase